MELAGKVGSGELTFILVSGLGAFTMVVMAVVAAAYGAKITVLKWFIALGFVILMPVAFYLHWALGAFLVIVAVGGVATLAGLEKRV
jgi:hypothetical protein